MVRLDRCYTHACTAPGSRRWRDPGYGHPRLRGWALCLKRKRPLIRPSATFSCARVRGEGARVGLRVVPLQDRAGVGSANASGLMHAFRAQRSVVRVQNSELRAQRSIVRVQNLAFRVQRSVFRVQIPAFRAKRSVFRAQHSAFRAQSSIVRIQIPAFRAQRSHVRVQASAFRARSSIVRVRLRKGGRFEWHLLKARHPREGGDPCLGALSVSRLIHSAEGMDPRLRGDDDTLALALK